MLIKVVFTAEPPLSNNADKLRTVDKTEAQNDSPLKLSSENGHYELRMTDIQMLHPYTRCRLYYDMTITLSRRFTMLLSH